MARPKKQTDTDTPRARRARTVDPFARAEKLHARWARIQTRADEARGAYEAVIAAAQADLAARQERLAAMTQ